MFKMISTFKQPASLSIGLFKTLTLTISGNACHFVFKALCCTPNVSCLAKHCVGVKMHSMH